MHVSFKMGRLRFGFFFRKTNTKPGSSEGNDLIIIHDFVHYHQVISPSKNHRRGFPTIDNPQKTICEPSFFQTYLRLTGPMV